MCKQGEEVRVGQMKWRKGHCRKRVSFGEVNTRKCAVPAIDYLSDSSYRTKDEDLGGGKNG